MVDSSFVALCMLRLVTERGTDRWEILGPHSSNPEAKQLVVIMLLLLHGACCPMRQLIILPGDDALSKILCHS